MSTKDFELDYMNLPDEVAKQTSLYSYWSEKAAYAREKRDLTANELQKLVALKELAVRDAAIHTGAKITEARVTAMINADPDVCQLKDKLVQMNLDMRLYESNVSTLEQKKTMIECAVKMALSGSMGMSLNGVSAQYNVDSSVERHRRILNENMASKGSVES